MLIVQKFGGTSVGDLDRIQNVANRVSKTKKDGNNVIVVVDGSKLTADAHVLTFVEHEISVTE